MGKAPKKHWSEMSRGQQAATVIGAVVQMSLLAAALWDLKRRPAAEIKGSKKAWAAISMVNFAGPISYFLFGRKRAAG